MSGEEIPKIIHYCWFGGKRIPRKARKCMRSWAKVLPEYELHLWNEKNFDVNSTPFTKEAYESKKYAFVTDYVRLFALYTVGGIYMDTDVEVIKPLDQFLKHSAFTSFEHPEFIPTGLMAAKKGNEWIKVLLDYYMDKHFNNSNGQENNISNTRIITEISVKEFCLTLNNSYQVLQGDVHIYPQNFFCPWNWKTNTHYITPETHAIHHFSGSWVPAKLRRKVKIIMLKNRMAIFLKNLLGSRIYNLILDNSIRRFKR